MLIASGLVAYLVAVAAVATALILDQQKQAEKLVVHSVVTGHNHFGQNGLKLYGQGLNRDLKLVLLPDTISSDRLLAQSLDRGHMFDVEVAGDYLVVARASYGLEIYNRHHAPLLAVEAHLDLGGRVVDVEIEGDYVYALLSDPARLCKVSIAAPLKPEIVSTLEMSGKPISLLVTKQTLFVTDHAQGLWQINQELEVIAHPEQFVGLDSAWQMATSDGQLFVAALDGRLWSIPLARGGQPPRLLKSFGRKIRGLAVDSRALHVFFKGGELLTYSVSPRGALERLDGGGAPEMHDHVYGIHLERQGELLLVLESTHGAKIYRRDAKGALTLLGSIIQSGNFSASAVVDDILYTTSTRGLSAWSLKDLTVNNQLQAPSVAHGVVFDMERWKDSLITDSHSLGVQVFDLQDLTKPPKVFPFAGEGGMAVNGDHLWVSRKGQSPEGFHIDNAAMLEPCGRLPGNDLVKCVRSFGKYLAVAGERGISVFSTENPCRPLLITRLPMENRVSDIVLQDGYAYAASDSGKEIVAFDWRQPAEPKLLGRYALPEPLRSFSRPRHLCLHNKLLYVALGRVGLLALDVSQPEAMQQAFYLDTPGFSGHLRVHEQILYVADLYGGLQLIDLENTEVSGVPRVIGSYRTAFDMQDVVFRDGKIYLAGGQKGLAQMQEPKLMHPQYVNGNEAFVPLPEGTVPGRYRLLAYNDTGHLNEDLVVTIPSLDQN